MSSLHISCPDCGFANDPSVERCYHCGQPLHLATKSVHKQEMAPLQSVRRRISRRTVLVGIGAGVVALPVIGGVAYLVSTKRPDPHRILTYSGHSGYAIAATWSPDGTRVASIGLSTSGTSSPQLQVWNATTGKRLLTGNLGTDVPPRLVVWSADGLHLLVFVGQYGSVPPESRIVAMVQLWDAATGQRVRTIPLMQPVPLTQPGALSDQVSVITGDLNEHYVAVATSRYDVASRRDDAVIGIWELATGRKVATLDPAPSPTATLQSSRSSTPLFAPWDGTPTPPPPSTPTPTNTPDLHNVQVEKLAWAPEGGKLAVLTLAGWQIWDTRVGKQLRTFPAVYQADTIIAWSPDGRSITVGNAIYDVETGHRLATSPVAGHLEAQAWSTDGKRLAVRSFTGTHAYGPVSGTILIVDASSGRQIAHYDEGQIDPEDTMPIDPSTMAWSPNGKELLVVQNTGIDIWSVD